MNYKYLFTPGKIGTLTIKNRVIMAPMSIHLSEEDGSVTDELTAYYVARALGGAGLIMTEYSFVNETGRSCDRQTSIANDSVIEGHAKMVKAIHDAGAKVCLQLQHGGRRSVVELTAPSNAFRRANASCLFYGGSLQLDR